MPVLCHAFSGSGGRVARLEWHAVHTRSCAEFRVRDRLEALGIPELLPTYSLPSQWHDRRRVIERPLFTGYLFARGERRELAAITGVAHVFGPVSDDAIAALAVAARDPERVLPCAPIPKGASVTVARGPFAGLTGRAVRSKAACRLIVTIDLLGRACAVEVDERDLIRSRAA